MKYFLLIPLFSAAFHCFAMPLPRTDEESLLARRIADCWKDKEFGCVKNQIEEFLSLFPDSPLVQHFCLLLGDIALQEKKYEESLEWYAKASSTELKNVVRLRRWHVLYQQKKYQPLRLEIGFYLKNSFCLGEEATFYYAEACFREGLSVFEKKKEEALELCAEALPHYKNLIEQKGVYFQNAKLSLAELYRLTGDPKEASILYLDLAQSAEKGSDTFQEEVLFHAAQSMSAFDKVRAVGLFSTLCREGKKCQKEAAEQWFFLLMKLQDWQAIEANQDRFLTLLTGDSLAFCHLTLGKIALEKQDRAAALAHLQKSIEGPLSAYQQKSAFMMTMRCSSELDDLSSFERAYQRYVEHFGKEESEISTIELMRVRLLSKRGLTGKALAILDAMEMSEEVCKEKIRILLSENRANEAHHTCSDFLHAHPGHPSFSRFAVEISLKKISTSPNSSSYQQLSNDLEKLLQQVSSLSKEEEEKYRLLLAKAYYGCDRIDSCHTVLDSYLADCQPSADAHFLMALCLWKRGDSPRELILHGEKALHLNPLFAEQSKLRLTLFNAYLELAKTSGENEKMHQAAEHLLCASETLSISLEKRLWLFHHYADYAFKLWSEPDAKKAIELIEPLLGSKESWFQLEEEALQLASLYELIKQRDRQSVVLQKLSSFQTTYKHLPWRFLEKTQLMRGHLAFSEKRWEEARSLYSPLENSSQAFIANEAYLQMTRVMICTLPAEQRTEGSYEALNILQRLRDLQLRKVLSQEPIHLEAAIEAAEFCASLKFRDEREKTLLQLLLEIKEDFMPQEDICSKDYHAARELFPEKEQIYQAYMRYLEAKIYLLQSRVAKRSGESVEGKAKESAARALFSTLRQGKFAVSRYLIEKASEGMNL